MSMGLRASDIAPQALEMWKAMNRRGLSVKTLSQATDVSETTIYNILVYRRFNPRPHVVAALTKELDIPYWRVWPGLPVKGGEEDD